MLVRSDAMATRSHENNLLCSICGEIFTNPVILSPCGHTFDHHCIANHAYCPLPTCRVVVSPRSFSVNYQMRELIERASGPVYEIFLLDTSTSMWYSDSFLGLFGRGRFDLAIDFLRVIFRERSVATDCLVIESLVVFPSDPFLQIAKSHW